MKMNRPGHTAHTIHSWPERASVDNRLGALSQGGGMKTRILAIDDDPDILDLLGFELEGEFDVVRAETADEGVARIAETRPSAIILDLHLPDRPGTDVLDYVVRSRPEIPVIILTAEDRVECIVELMKQGAFDYVPKPLEPARLLTSVRNGVNSNKLQSKLHRVTETLGRGRGFGSLIGESPAMKAAMKLLQRAATTDVSVLITGESGTGKEVAAQALHFESAWRSGPFVAVNCGAIPENLIESELFGYEKGAFTGATSTRPGKFEQADGGTIFLDEIGELRVDLQVRLLRVLQEQAVDRLGGTEVVPIDVRVIAATNRDLKDEIASGNFREDLYYRLSVFPIHLPALKSRDSDLALLATHFLNHYAVAHDRQVRGFSAKAWNALNEYAWPGNIRELMNSLERAVILEDSEIITLASLPDVVVCGLSEEDISDEWAGDPVLEAQPTPSLENPQIWAASTGEEGQDDVVVPLAVEEERIIRRALAASNWNVKVAAERLEIGRATIYRKIEKYGLSRSSAREI